MLDLNEEGKLRNPRRVRMLASGSDLVTVAVGLRLLGRDFNAQTIER